MISTRRNVKLAARSTAGDEPLGLSVNHKSRSAAAVSTGTQLKKRAIDTEIKTRVSLWL